MAIGIYFDGRRLIRPQAVTKIDDSGMFGHGLGGANVLALIGECTGGNPQVPLYFTDPSYAKAILKSGPLLQAVQRAFDPSVDVPGASNITAIRVNPAVQAALSLIDSLANIVIDLKSIDYGQWNNQIKVRIQTGTTLDPLTNKYGKLITLTYGQSFEQGDNIAKKSIYLALADPKSFGMTGTYNIASGVLTTDVVSNLQHAFVQRLGGTPSSTDETANAGGGGSNVPIDLTKGTGLITDTDYLYIGSDQPFGKLNFTKDAVAPNAAAAVLTVEYYKNDATWVALSVTDGTQSPAGTPFAKDGSISWTIPGAWATTQPTYQPTWAAGSSALPLYWVRISVQSGSSLTASSKVDSIVVERGLSVTLADYPTIQQLVDYLNSQPGYEAGAITTTPDTDLSSELDDVSNVSLLSGSSTYLTTSYDPATSLYLVVNSVSGFVVGDYISISRDNGSMSESRVITKLSTGKIYLSSPLAATYQGAGNYGAVVQEAVILNSDLQAVIDWFNNTSSYVTAEYHSGATVRNVPVNIGDTYLTDGSEGSTDQEDWDTCINALQTEDTPLISCISYDPAVWASLSAHVSYMSTVGKKERRGFCGGFYGNTGGLGKWNGLTNVMASIDQMIAYALGLNSDRMCYVGPGFTGYDENGLLTTYNGAISAALVAGMAAGVDVATALTHKTIKVVGLEYNFRWSDLDRLLEAGVLPLSYDPGVGYRVEQSITTWLTNDKYNRRELSVGRTADYVARQVRERLEMDFVGSKGTLTTLISIKNATISVLNTMFRLALLAGDANNPPFKNVQVTLDGDTAYVEFECSPVIPINYIPITIHLTVFTTTITG